MTLIFVIALAVLVGLFLVLFHEVRRAPDPSARWKKSVRVGLVTTVLLMVLSAFWAFLIEPNRLVIQHSSIKITNWPAGLSGLRIAVLADIHVGSAFIDDRKLRLIVERTNALQPDLIIILGDYMTGNLRGPGRFSRKVEPEIFSPILKDFRAQYGVYSVLGNHDWWNDGNRLRVNLEKYGIRVLENEVFEVKLKGTSLWLAGLSDLWTRPQHLERTINQVPQGQTMIAITHNPDTFPRISAKVPLTLAGHTHGGQVRFPIIGTLIQPSDFGQRYVRGHVIENNHHLFVTSGIGTSILPVRFLVPPEIVLLTLE